ncbi:hypothetical protein [Aporhodopirellula aestuarii]|uniref:Uncharacterized protein n=1 Tax=Aporhodopirellula aestuarii TaxID=2950107 RepID=A0ABT0TY89_9BACT|nr:hypothetical protein [Aporhodopirellula aestuarii]MCM2369572.1 hypothetical protein [Aporhodopirellula aestuarii]
MKRTINRAVATASTRTRRYKNIAIALAASASLLAAATSAQAFGGHGGERIVSSEVVSDVVVGESYEGAVVSGGTGAVQNREYGQPDLFYNFYTQGPANSANAQMYVSPVPVPPNVGHTFLTYQPFYPHEMLYKHTDRFHNYYDGGRGMNRTRVSYSYPPVKTAVSNFYWNVLRIPR